MSSAFIRDDALLILHHFLPCMINGKKEISKVNSTEIYLLWCARNNRNVCLAPFIWSQIANFQTKRGAHLTLSYIATGLARHLGIDIAECEGIVHSQEITPVELVNVHLMRSVVEFVPMEDRASVRKYFLGQQHGQRNEEEEDEEGGNEEEG